MILELLRKRLNAFAKSQLSWLVAEFTLESRIPNILDRSHMSQILKWRRLQKENKEKGERSQGTGLQSDARHLLVYLG